MIGSMPRMSVRAHKVGFESMHFGDEGQVTIGLDRASNLDEGTKVVLIVS